MVGLFSTGPTLSSFWIQGKKSCIRETLNLSTDADGRTNTILERLLYFIFFWLRGFVIFFLMILFKKKI